MKTNWLKKTWGLRTLAVLGLVLIGVWPLSSSGQLNLLTVEDSTLIIPAGANDKLGAPNSMAVADFNDDGFADILVGAPNADRPNSGSTTADNGIAYVIYGEKPFPDEIDLRSFTNADVVIIGADFGDRLGTAVAAGDVNGDGIPDIILGAPDADGALNQDSETGEVYVIFGATDLPNEINLATYVPPVRVLGRIAQAGYGSTLTTLDLNADGFEDIIIGQPLGSGPGGSRPEGGNVYVYFGSADIVSPVPDIGFKRPDITFYGADAGDRLGAALDGGDLNADGLGDLVIGAPFGDGPANRKENAGEVYVLSGARNLPALVDLASSTTTGTGSLQVLGGDKGDRLGTAVSVGDADRDGFDDLLIGAPMAGGPDNTRGFSGQAYLVLGEPNLPPVIEVDKNGGIAIEIFGAEALDGLGNAVVLNDIDGDGYADLVVAASNAEGAEDKAGAGKVYMLRGRALFDREFDLADNEANALLQGGETGGAFGSALAVGNLEGDAKGNLLVGAVKADGPGGRTDSGLINVFITVEDQPPAQPTANAGPDWCMIPGSTVPLDASGSTAPTDTTLSYLWEVVSQPEGSEAVISDPSLENATFTADMVGEYVVQLTVATVFGGSDIDQITIYVLNKGDVNFDGIINQVDAQLVADYIVGLVVFTDQQRFVADVRPVCLGDPNLTFDPVDVNDVRWIAEYPFKGPQEPTCQNPYPKDGGSGTGTPPLPSPTVAPTQTPAPSLTPTPTPTPTPAPSPTPAP